MIVVQASKTAGLSELMSPAEMDEVAQFVEAEEAQGRMVGDKSATPAASQQIIETAE